MKYTKLFNNHNEYVAYTGSTAFIRPNVSYCILEDEPHCTPADFKCQDNHVYEVIGEPSYPETVAASATSFTLSFDYNDTHTLISCEVVVTTDTENVSVAIEENPSTESRTISGSYNFHGISIPYSLTQEGREDLPYNQQYLTFEILTGGTILWKAATTSVTRTISYSVNNGEWTEITSTTNGVEINVSAGDKVRFKGTNQAYGTAKDTVSTFSGSTAVFDAYGNAMSLIGGDNFSGLTSFTTDWAFHDLLNTTNVVSAKNLILPATTLTTYCYRAMFAHATSLAKAPELPATTLAQGCYWYMFQDCPITTAPDLNATTLVAECYGGMFNLCSNLNYIKCMATSGFGTSKCLEAWTNGVANRGTFVKDADTAVVSGKWTRGVNGIPTNWLVQDEGVPDIPSIQCNGFEIELFCATTGADIYYRLTNGGSYSAYTTPITMTGDTFVECYAEKDSYSSITTSMTCEYDDRTIYEYANQSLNTWSYNDNTITTPYSVNAIDGHSSNYAKGTFNFETTVNLRQAEPTYLWFQHADQSATIYVDNELVEKHWGGYAAFTVDISNYTHKGTNNIKVSLKNNEGNYLAPASGDFNFNATLGNVKLFTSPYVPAMNYGYDGFHITSTASTTSATINVKTSIPTGATVVCTISGTNCNYTATSASTGAEMIFATTISNPRLWNGKIDPYLYNVKLEIYHDNVLYHSYERPYGFRFYEYVIDDTVKVGTQEAPYTGFLLNGAKYLLRGCCMHDDIDGKANALNDTDYINTFNTIQELGLNFLRLAHYPHPKEVYDWCDRLGIIVQTEGPCVNKMQSTMPGDYYIHLNTQYSDMVNQHYNHPCILFWGLSNETTTDDKNFAKEKIEGYTTFIKSLDPERWVGYVLAQSPGTSPSAYYNDPQGIDWFGCNIYVGWYDSPNSNNPSSQITTRLNNTIYRAGVNKPMAYSEYGCGGTQRCHSDSASTTTNKGSGGARHDIEYMMWLHEGHIATIKNYPQLLSTSQWQLFDIAVSNRNEGYTVCLDGETTTINEDLRRLNDKGLVERDHVTKKDTFYLYKAWWNTADTFVHICGKDYTKRNNRVIKCYTNETSTLTLYINGTSADTATITDNIAVFPARNFNNGDVVMVSGATSSDEFMFEYRIVAKFNVTDTSRPTDIGYNQYISGFSAIEIDGVEQPSVVSAYTFSTTGEHTIKYTLRYSRTIDSDAFRGCSKITSIEIPNSVTRISQNAFYDCSSLSSITIPNSVVTIGSHAFYSCGSLSNITLPNSITSIGKCAFWYCYSLKNITLPDSVTNIAYGAFMHCKGLTNVNIPSGVTSIDSYVFEGCEKLPSMTIPDNVTSIGEGAFTNCKSLKNISISSGVTSIGDAALWGCTSLSSITVDADNEYYSSEDGVLFNEDKTTLIQYPAGNSRTSYTIPSGVTNIGEYSFMFAKKLTNIVIPDTVTSIGDSAFDECHSIKTIGRIGSGSSIEIPSSITSISAGAFGGCSGLTNVDMPDSITSIGAGAFSDCGNLTSVTISSGATSIGSSAFYKCKKLSSITIPDNVASIGAIAFCLCSNLKSIAIPSATTNIAKDFVTNCDNLTGITVDSNNSVYDSRDNCNAIIETATNTLIAGCKTSVIPNTIATIGKESFEYCGKLTRIVIPDSVTSIGEAAFRECLSVTSCIIGSGVTSIDQYAFYYLVKLTALTINAITPPTLNGSVFSGTYPIYVPSGSVEAYKSESSWASYADRIQAIP